MSQHFMQRITWQLPGTFVLLLLVSHGLAALAQPTAGDVFREYRWTNTGGDAGGSLRVGGRVGYDGSPLKLPQQFDLKHATRAEVVLEKLLCHAGTRGLAISVNGNPWIAVPECSEIPKPQWNYQHHTYPIVSVPLKQLHDAAENQFRLQVAAEHPWDWPQHLIYGVHFRIYYDPALKPHPAGKLVSPKPNTTIGLNSTVQVEATSPNSTIRQVDFLGHYDGVNLEGDGRYRQWHYHYVRAKLAGHIGSVTRAPWKFDWNTEWVPDQQQAIGLAARITDGDGITYQTPSISQLTLEREGLGVELCKPYDVPERWVTRTEEFTEKFRIDGNLKYAVAAQLVWCSWSPGYMEGVFVNGQEVLDREGPRYAYFVHRVPLQDLSVLRPGQNLLTTGKTPKYDGKMVHGMEVNWPGIMVLIQYQLEASNGTPHALDE